jgi:hypothetical protein
MAKKAKDVEEKTSKENTIQKQDEEITVEQKLIALYNLQQTDTQIDKIRIVRGEL